MYESFYRPPPTTYHDLWESPIPIASFAMLTACFAATRAWSLLPLTSVQSRSQWHPNGDLYGNYMGFIWDLYGDDNGILMGNCRNQADFGFEWIHGKSQPESMVHGLYLQMQRFPVVSCIIQLWDMDVQAQVSKNLTVYSSFSDRNPNFGAYVLDRFWHEPQYGCVLISDMLHCHRYRTSYPFMSRKRVVQNLGVEATRGCA